MFSDFLNEVHYSAVDQLLCARRMLWKIFYVALSVLILVLISAVSLVLFARKYFRKRRNASEDPGGHLSIAFFHPYCNAGGGGERVLWCAIRAIHNKYPDCKVVVYTGDINASPTEIIKRVHQRFEIKLDSEKLDFIYLHKRGWLEPKRYPYFTLLLQSLGSVIVGLEALCAFIPDIYVDSTGFAFTLPLFSYIGGCSTACYVHYPTITTEMLKRVSSRVVAHNNRGLVARNPILSSIKILYYKIFAWMYGMFGRFADTVMVNSSWTEEHINNIWQCPLSTHRVYPPCDTHSLKSLPMAKDISEGGKIKIVSVGQFRPEKDHPLQLKAMYELRNIVSEQVWERIKLVFVGSCRGPEDDIRVKDMMDLCKHLSLEDNVEFKINVPYDELKKELSTSIIGLHAMWNEHFGIGVVECMAASQIMVAHRSGGPRADIIEEAEGSRNGFLAADESEYANAIAAIVKMPAQMRNKIREAARSSVDRFSTEEFDKGFLRAIEPLLSMKRSM